MLSALAGTEALAKDNAPLVNPKKFLRMPVDPQICLMTPGSKDKGVQDNTVETLADDATLGLSFVGLIGEANYVRLDRSSLEAGSDEVIRAAKRKLDYISFDWTVLPVFSRNTAERREFFRLFLYNGKLVPECYSQEKELQGKEALTDNPIQMRLQIEVESMREVETKTIRWEQRRGLSGSPDSEQWIPEDRVLLSLVVKKEEASVLALALETGGIQEAWKALSRDLPAEYLGDQTRDLDAYIDPKPVCRLFKAVKMYKSCDHPRELDDPRARALDVTMTLFGDPIRFMSGGKHDASVLLTGDPIEQGTDTDVSPNATDETESDADKTATDDTPLAERQKLAAAIDARRSAKNAGNAPSSDSDLRSSLAESENATADDTSAETQQDKTDSAEDTPAEPTPQNTAWLDNAQITDEGGDDGKDKSTAQPVRRNRQKPSQDDGAQNDGQEQPAESQPEKILYSVQFDNMPTSNKWTVAIFPDEISCRQTVSSGDEIEELDTKQRKKAKAREQAHVLFLEKSNVVSLCTPGELNKETNTMAFAFSPIKLPERKVAVVLPLSRALGEVKADKKLKYALRYALEELSQDERPSTAVSVYTINGERAVNLVIRPEQLAILRQMDPEQRKFRLQRLGDQFQFNADKLSPIEDTRYLYGPLRKAKVSRIIYVVDEEDPEKFESKLNMGPIFGWLMFDNISLTVISADGCDGWRDTFKDIGAKLNCIDMKSRAMKDNDEFAKALVKEIRPKGANNN